MNAAAELPLLQRFGIGLAIMGVCALLFTVLVVANPMPTVPKTDTAGERGCHEWFRVLHGEGDIALVYHGATSADPDIAQSSRVLANYLNPKVRVAFTHQQALDANEAMSKACTAHGWFR